MPSERRPYLWRVGVRQRLYRLILLCALFGSCSAAAEPNVEYGVKAAFLLNFTRFITWPPTAFADSQSAMEICVLGRDPFGRILDDVVQGEAANGRKLVVRRISEAPAGQACQVLFIDSEWKDMRNFLRKLPPGVVTVSEGDRFIRDGGMIALIVENRRVRFDINQAASEEGGVKLSSKLLGIARSVSR